MRTRRVVVGIGGAVLTAFVVAGGAGGAAAEQQPTTTTTTAPLTTPTTAVPGSAIAVAQAIAGDGWYADPDAVGDREQLADVAENLSTSCGPMGFALLSSEPPGGSPAFAEDVLDALPGQGEFLIRTVVVLSDADVGVVSDIWDDDAIDAALDESIDQLRADPTDGLDALAAALSDQPQGFDDEDDGGGGDPTGLIILGGVGVLGLVAASRYFSGSGDLADGDGGTDGIDGGGGGWGGQSSWARRRSYRSFRSSSSRRSSSSSRRRSSSSSRRGRGGRRL